MPRGLGCANSAATNVSTYDGQISFTSVDVVTLNMVGDFTAAQGEKLVLDCVGLNGVPGTITSLPNQELKIILFAVDRSTQSHQ